MPPFGPGVRAGGGVPRVAKTLPVVRNYAAGETGIFQPRDGLITGVSRDSTGAALGGCTVKLYDNATDQCVATTISDGSGNFSFAVQDGTQWYLRFYLAGAPDRAGTTKNAVQGE